MQVTRDLPLKGTACFLVLFFLPAFPNCVVSCHQNSQPYYLPRKKKFNYPAKNWTFWNAGLKYPHPIPIKSSTLCILSVRKTQHTNHPDVKIKKLSASWVIPRNYLVARTDRCPRKTEFPEKALESVLGKNRTGEEETEWHHSNRRVFLRRETSQNIFLPNSKWLLLSVYTAHSAKRRLRQERWRSQRENTLLVGRQLNRQMEVNLLTNAFAHTVYFVCWDQYHPY